MKVTLTFDNGPVPGVTEHVLDILSKHEIAASFFILGRHIAVPAGRAIVADALARGHIIGNHSFSHSVPLGRLNAQEAISEIRKTEELLHDFIGPQKFFRPFGGKGVLGQHLLNEAAWSYLVDNRYTCVLWNCLAREWDHGHEWPMPTIKSLDSVEHGVVVLHDLNDIMIRPLEDFIMRLKDQGRTFVQHYPDDCLALKQGREIGLGRSIVASTSYSQQEL